MELGVAKEELDDLEAAALHAWVRRFDHRFGGRGLGLKPWYIDGYLPPDATVDACAELAEAVIASLRELTSAGDFVHFVDVEHAYARFYPHRVDVFTFGDVFIDGETSGYFAVDRSWGLVSCRWSDPSLVCFFGEPLLARLRHRAPRLLGALVPVETSSTS